MPDLYDSILRIAIFAVPLLLGVVCHEVAHGYAAYVYGDSTAKDSGRLTLNPIPHLDATGTLVFVLTSFFGNFVIGWAKPVPVNPARFRNIRQGIVVVSAAGAMANFTLAALFYLGFSLVTSGNANSAFMNYLQAPLVNIFAAGVLVNCILGVFNLLPIPPLDGSKILAAVLPRHLARQFMRIEQYGFFILLILLFTGALRFVFTPVLNFVYGLLM
jgi:Zn-dependent protease